MFSAHRSGKSIAVASAAAILLAWIGVDLYYPRQADLREFDPVEVARLDNAIWRSFYYKERVRLFFQLAELLRTQFHFPFLKSHLVAFSAARAAFVFKEGQTRADYEKALPDLIDYFTAIRERSLTPFDVDSTSKLELEWWIIHRERGSRPPGELERSLAEASAVLYRVPPERLTAYGRLRAEAKVIRDIRAIQGGVTEDDWKRIEELLRGSWQSLWEAVNSPRQPGG